MPDTQDNQVTPAQPETNSNQTKSVPPSNKVQVAEEVDNQMEKQDQEGTESPSETKDESSGTLFKSFDQKSKKSTLKPIVVVILVIVAGIASGFGLSRLQSGGGMTPRSTENVSEGGVQAGDVFGLKDESTFRDQAQGIVVKGGVDGEGSHHIVRPGGDSQSVYLTSSTVDLDVFVDHKVKVWGETFSAQTAGWLMDVGRVEVLELNAEKPTVE